MKKPLFYRLNAGDFLSAVVQVPDSEKAEWIMKLAIDLVGGEINENTAPFAAEFIAEANEYSKKKSDAAHMRWNAQHMQTDAPHMHSNASSSSKNIKNKPIGVKRFTPPTIDQVRAYCVERDNGVHADSFIDHYTAKGWMIGKNKMKDWKAAVRTWERTSPKKQKKMTDLIVSYGA